MKKDEKMKIRKRFFITLLGFFSICIIPLVYINYGIDTAITTAVITGIITLVSIYVVGQSSSDSISNWKNNDQI